MKKPLAVLVSLIIFAFLTSIARAQSFSSYASGVSLTNCTQSNFFNTTGSAPYAFGPPTNMFNNANLGIYTQNSGTLILRGGGIKTSKGVNANVCSARMYYRVYLQSGVPGAFTSVDLTFVNNCDVPSGQFPGGGGACNAAGDQLWQVVAADGTTVPFAPVNLTSMPAGTYILEVYYQISGSNTTTTGCSDLVTLNNGGNNYKASFSIQSPSFASNNPVTCNGSDGYITIGGLVAGATYTVTYTKNGVAIPSPLILTANSSGQIVVSNLTAGLYSNFAIQVGGCSTNLFFGTVLSNPIFIPTFAAIAPFCAGTTPPTLQTTSLNGINGTWNPAVIDNLASRSYTFTPGSGTCGFPVTINVTVTPRTTPTFAFGTSLSICGSGTVPSLPNTSTNGVTGTWSPAVVDNQNSGTYTFTPGGTQCANPATFTVTVTPNVTPAFSFGTSLTVCNGATVPTLPGTSTNGITGTWSPATVSNTTSGTYTFTPTAGQCALPTSFSVTVNPMVTPTFSFGTSLTICASATVPTLPGTSTNGITGTWSPTTVNNTTSGSYTFTPSGGQCANPAMFTVTVTPNITPTFAFGTALTICGSGTVPTLPGTSTNSITGTWSPATVSNTASGTYTFTPTAGQCALPATFSVTVNPNITPTFSFGTSLTVCSGGTVPALPNTSGNTITGTWSPATVSNTTSGTYTFTPTAGQCALPATFTVTINPNITPTFSFGTAMTVCAGASVPTLPGTSTNGITGTWNPATVDNQNSGSYTFTPASGQCAVPAGFTLTVTPNVTPTFSFGTAVSICKNGVAPSLPGTSTNAITGTWSPATVSNTTSGTYTFTPTSGQCALNATLNVTVNVIIMPTFDFGNTLTICAGSTAPVLPGVSTNGINGTWSPATINNQNSGVYTFTPDPGQCASPGNLTVTIKATTMPVFSIGTALSICAGGTVPALPTTSTNSIDGVWSPAVVDNQNSGTYTFTPNATPQQCILNATYDVTVNPIVTPAFSFGNSLSICIGATVPALVNTSSNGVTGAWSAAAIDNQTSGTYTFTPAGGQCAVPMTLTVEVNPVPTVSVRPDTSLYDGEIMPQTVLTGTPSGVPNFNWTNSEPGIGLPGSGTGNIPSFKAINMTDNQVVATITVTPNIGGCFGTAQTFHITVKPLNKDVFVPNVFTPNGDGKNDKLFAYGNYIDKLEMRIFNQWGQQVAFINSVNQGWDGTHRGKPQPVGVYVYVLKAVLTYGKTVQLKGSITLLR